MKKVTDKDLQHMNNILKNSKLLSKYQCSFVISKFHPEDMCLMINGIFSGRFYLYYGSKWTDTTIEEIKEELEESLVLYHKSKRNKNSIIINQKNQLKPFLTPTQELEV